MTPRYESNPKWYHLNNIITVGYVATQENPLGWVLQNLRSYEETEFFQPRVYRIDTGSNTTLIQFSKNFKSIHFFDNANYLKTGESAYEEKSVPLTKFYFDSNFHDSGVVLNLLK